MSGTIAEAPGVFAGRVEEVSDAAVVLCKPGTDYRLRLAVASPLGAQVKDRVTGRILAQARRVDVVPSGGRYVEPVYGRPRRVQGRIVAGDPAANTIVVDAAVPVTATLMAGQSASNFSVGQLVSFDVERGAVFEPIA